MKMLTAGVVILFTTLFGLTACEHTVQGFGQDMQSNGQKIEKSMDN